MPSIPSSMMARINAVLFQDNPHRISPKLVAFLIANPTLLLTGLYVCVSGLGLLFEIVLFKQFGIEILDYSEAADFFLAAFKRTTAVASLVLVLSTIYVFRLFARLGGLDTPTKLGRYILRLFSKIGSLRRDILVPFSILYFLSAYATLARFEAIRITDDSSAVITISTKTVGFSELRVIPIGATGKVLFGIEPMSEERPSSADRQAEVRPRVWGVPFTDIARIQYQTEGAWRDRPSPSPALQGTRD